MISIIFKGGILMIPILLCSLAVVTIVIERIYYFMKSAPNGNGFMDDIVTEIKGKNEKQALKKAKTLKGVVPRVIAAGIKEYINHKAEHYIEKALSRKGTHELFLLERNLRGLNVIANVAPLLGLLGTVLGMIKAFMQIEVLGGSVDPSSLAGGIWEAMTTTAAGLTVAIPALLFYNYFMGRVNRIEAQMKSASVDLIDIVREREKNAV